MLKERSIKNLFWGLLSFVVTTLLGIIIPRLFLVSYGSETNGLINSVKQIFSYFALLEAGVGGATLQALYGPMARKEKNEISSILSATNNFYKRTGLVYAGAVILLAILYPLFVKTTVPTGIVVCIILFQGESGVVKYLVTSKLQLLLKVDGKNYILTNLGTIFAILSNISRIILMYTGFNVLWVQGVFCIIDICQVIFIILYTRKYYGWLNLKSKPNYNAISQKNSVLIHQLSGLVFNNTDTIILTFFCGLKVVSVYAMYALLFGMVANIIGYISSSVSFAMGQLFNSDRKRFEKVQEIYETYYLAFSFAFFTIAYIFILPFLKLYTSGISDINYIDKWIPVLFVTFQILNYGRNTSNSIIDYAGHYKQTKWRSILETVINLVVSIVCVYKLGIYGVLLGTIAALLYRTNDIILYANNVIMKRSAWPTYRRWIRNIIILILCAYVGNILPKQYSNYRILFLSAIIVSVVVLILFISINTFCEKEVKMSVLEYAKKILKKRR